VAYALGPIGPDERHERIFVRRRSRRGVILVFLAALVMAVSAGGLLALYRSTMHSGNEVPLLRADNQPTRKRPEDPGGLQVPGQGTMVLDHGRGEAGVEQLLPPPETPLPRPVAVPPPTQSPAQTANTAPATAPTLPAVEPAAPAPVATAPTPPPTEAAAPPAPPPKPAAAPRPQIAAAPAPPGAGSGYRLQIGAVRTPEAAKAEWERLKHHNGDVLGALGYEARRVDLGDRGIFYRIQAGPIADAAAAERDCSELKRRGVGCLLVRP
jgi:cell division protein FtsN